MNRKRLRAREAANRPRKTHRPDKRTALPVEALPQPRSRSAQVLGRSISSIIRLENAGVLTPIRQSPTAQLYHRVKQAPQDAAVAE